GGGDIASKTVSSDDTTGANEVHGGTYYVNESPDPPANYTRTLACENQRTTPATPVTVGANNSVVLGTGDAIVCTFTNTYVKATRVRPTTASGPVTAGQPIHDPAPLTGGRQPLTGTISFQVFADANCQTPLSPAPASATVNGTGDYQSGEFTPT